VSPAPERFDAIVVGAGPAGSTAARHLAEAGASVLLLDRARFPRDKPCGGGVTVRAARRLPFSLAPVVEGAVDTLEVSVGYARRFARTSAAPLVFMTERRELDRFLAGRAAEAGAELRDGVKVTVVEDADGRVAVRGDGLDAAAPLAIGADGVNGVTARTLGAAGARRLCVGLEGDVPYGAADRERYRGRAVLALGVVPGGYAWVFPKAAHLNVGVAAWEPEGPRLRERLGRLLDAYGLPAGALQRVRGYRLPHRAAGAPLARGRVALVGDAAGLVDPLSGDGIYEAFVSARAAADAALDLLAGRATSLEPYRAALLRELGREAAESWGWKLAFDRFPRLGYTVARAPVAWPTVERLLRGELHDRGARRPADRVPLLAFAALARLAGDPGASYRRELRGEIVEERAPATVAPVRRPVGP
jgi:geranylgeranyl reductase family protein